MRSKWRGVVTEEGVTLLSNALSAGTTDDYYPQCDFNSSGEIDVFDIITLTEQAQGN